MKSVPEKRKFFDRSLQAFLVSVSAGEFGVTGEQDVYFTTTLGSCISVCMRDAGAHIGGMNHIMLPGRSDDENKATNAALFGDYAMEVLINGIIRAGGRKQRLEAKVFGGANVMSAVEGMGIGDSNSRFATKFLGREGIPVLAQDTGGVYARRILFRPYDGRVLLNSMGIGSAQGIVKGEAKHRLQLQHSDRKSDIEIFR